MKKCSVCEKRKKESGFYKHKNGRDGLRAECKECSRGYTKKYADANPEKQKKWREENKDRCKALSRKSYLSKKYGISDADYKKMYDEQNGKCAICLVSKKKLNIDHCHVGLNVRGLLCGKCNRGLGNFKDNIEALKNAIKYLS